MTKNEFKKMLKDGVREASDQYNYWAEQLLEGVSHYTGEDIAKVEEELDYAQCKLRTFIRITEAFATVNWNEPEERI